MARPPGCAPRAHLRGALQANPNPGRLAEAGVWMRRDPPPYLPSPNDEEYLAQNPASDEAINKLAKIHNNLPGDAFRALGVGYSRDPEEKVWLVPLWDHQDRIISLLRWEAIMGGEQTTGLLLPKYPDSLPTGPIYLAHNVPATAALYAAGVLAFGVSRLLDGLDPTWLILVEFLKRHPRRKIIVATSCDQIAWASRAAQFLRLTLARNIRVAIPAAPYALIKEQVGAGMWDKGLQFPLEK